MKNIKNLIGAIFISFLMISSSVLLAQNQRVGVGTTAPTDGLHVKAAQTDHALRVQVGSSTKLRVLNNGGTSLGTNNTNSTPANGLYVHGNTGLGVGNPANKLDVNGDINLSGELKTNGASGTEGQILTANGNGGMSWSDLSNFKNFEDFFNPDATNTWTVPAGVTQAIFEFWGAGGGGGDGGGGGGGGYVKILLTVNPGAVYTITLGSGGTGKTTINSATSGGMTSMSGPGISALNVHAGGAGIVSPGFGAGSQMDLSLNSIRLRGGGGKSNHTTYAEYAAGSFAQMIQYGSGGSTAFFSGTGGAGDMIVRDANTLVVQDTHSGRGGVQPGGGGGGGDFNDGGDAYCIVRW